MKKIFNRLTLLLVPCLFSSNGQLISNDIILKDSSFVEKEQPELSEETKELISIYQKDPSLENYLLLKEEVIKNYDAVIDKKEAKLEELKLETEGKKDGEELVEEMQEIVQEMYITYWNRINSTMLRFGDSRLLKWKISEAKNYDYIPVMGAGDSIYIKRYEVTNKEYLEFINDTGYKVPSSWVNGTYTSGEDDYPVNNISYEDVLKYCEYLTDKDGKNSYRLPSESEWELAAGHMPKDADFNCDLYDHLTSVFEYEDVTRGAHGAIDFWGNVWEMTSTIVNQGDTDTYIRVKGGAYNTTRNECRTEYHDEYRSINSFSNDLGFRVIQVKNGVEPTQKADLYTLDIPNSYYYIKDDSTYLYWDKIEEAYEYQVFEYDEDTGLFSMLDKTSETSTVINDTDSNKKYVVQALSYVAISDNVSKEYVATYKEIEEDTSKDDESKEEDDSQEDESSDDKKEDESKDEDKTDEDSSSEDNKEDQDTSKEDDKKDESSSSDESKKEENESSSETQKEAAITRQSDIIFIVGGLMLISLVLIILSVFWVRKHK